MYSHRSPKNGQLYWLHTMKNKYGGTLYFFSKDIVDSIDLPDGFDIVISKYTGLPRLKKKVDES